jgi:predicted HicB family RNase H-like nuclease
MMVKMQVYLPKQELRALHLAAKRSGKSVAQLVREASGTRAFRRA